jgi:hypothetical protein
MLAESGLAVELMQKEEFLFSLFSYLTTSTRRQLTPVQFFPSQARTSPDLESNSGRSGGCTCCYLLHNIKIGIYFITCSDIYKGEMTK